MARIIHKKESHFIGAWNYIKESRKYIYFAAILFILGTLGGIVFQGQLGALDDLLKGIIDQVKDLGLTELIWFIFKNNSLSAFFALSLGVFFGLFSMFNATFNGVILGYVFSKAVSKEGIGVVWKVLPHGIFELPAILIAVGLGIRLGLGFFENYSLFSFLSSSKKGKSKNDFAKRFYSSLKVFFFIILPLLAIAAVIEGLLIFLYK